LVNSNKSMYNARNGKYIKKSLFALISHSSIILVFHYWFLTVCRLYPVQFLNCASSQKAEKRNSRHNMVLPPSSSSVYAYALRPRKYAKQQRLCFQKYVHCCESVRTFKHVYKALHGVPFNVTATTNGAVSHKAYLRREIA
jgi:hypothetical protein